MSEIDTYLKCTSHNSIVMRSGLSNRMVHKKSGGLCDSTRFTLVRTTVLNRDEAFDWADRIERGVDFGDRSSAGRT